MKYGNGLDGLLTVYIRILVKFEVPEPANKQQNVKPQEPIAARSVSNAETRIVLL